MATDAQLVLLNISRSIRDIISNASNSITDSVKANCLRKVSQCMLNLERVRGYIDNEKYEAIVSCLDELKRSCLEAGTDNLAFTVPRASNGIYVDYDLISYA